MRTLRTDYAAVNGRNVTVYSFGDLPTAKAWAKDNAHLHDGLRIERVTLSADTVYTPRVARRRPDFSIPQWGAVSPVGVQ